MANDIDKTSPHYKGDFGSIYEVNKKFPTGGVAGDFVVIEGWAHYWNADRASWCVNAERDSYWDELITNFIEKFKLIRGGTYMGVASLDTVPAKVIGAKMYYFATVAGTYKNFGDLVVPQGINVFYSENGRSWVNTTLLEVVQELGVNPQKVVSQKAIKTELDKKADKETVNTELDKKADKEAVNKELDKKADKETVNTELDKKADKEAVNKELAKKADKTSVSSSLDLKANKIDVAKENAKQDAEINRKANQRDVESALNILRKEIGDRTVIEGNVNNNPDEEDLTSKSISNGTMVLSLKDRDYNPLEYSGKGYKILRKNLHEVTCAITKIEVTKVPTTDGYVSIIINGVETHVNLVASTDNTVAIVAKKIADKLYETLDEYVTSVDGALVTSTRRFGGDVTTSSFSGVNTGSEATVSESSKTELRNLITPVMINQPNTIYEIRYDFDLDGAALEMPDNCTLKFAGGMLKDGNICSNFTKFQGSPLLKDINIKYNIYDKFGNQISKKTYKEIRKDINVIFPLVGWDEESAKLVCQNANSAQIENVQIIYYTKYDNSSNSISTPELSFLSRGIKAIVDYIQKYRLKIYSIKFHKGSGYSDNPSLEEKIAYGEYVKNVVSEYLKYTDTIKTVFISNEEPDRTCIGNNWNGVHLDLIEWLHGLKIKVGISDLNVSQIINMDNNLYNNIDYPGLNFYPSLSYYDLDTNESHIPNMIENCSCLLKSYVDSVQQRGMFKCLSITESGVVCRDKALRRPYDWDNLGERNHTGVIPYLYHKTLLNSCIKTGIPEYYAWYLETEDFNKPIVNDFFDSFMFK